MTDREKLIELIQSAVDGCATYWAGLIADHLVANGVTVQKENTMANPDVAVFKSQLQQLQADFTRLKDTVDKIHTDDPATGAQLKKVTLQLLDKLRQEVG